MSPALRRRRRQQEQMMQMQAMSNPSMFFYLGDIANLDRKLQDTMAQGIPITDIYIRVTGVQVSQFNLCLLMVTIMLGAFLFVPLFAMCYDCWKKAVYPTYEVPTYVYQKLQCIISTQCVRTIFIEVCDNNLNRQKGQILYQLLSMSSAQSFILSNSAANMDFKEDQYSNFIDNMKPIKMLPVQSTIKWWTQIVS